ncbi:MAG: glycosyltransferase [Burkholderiales bacterium]|nr:glycosyltransferase [Burkholderiales bacterium]
MTYDHSNPAPGDSRRLRILLSAYACEPHKGSEPGVGWRWAVALARARHEVWVLTRANNRTAIESAVAAEPVPGLHFVYYDLPAWASSWKRGGRGVRLYYVLWQWGAYRVAKRLCRELRFDVAHHITFGVFRHPSFMAFLDVPFVFGPLGGGETAPVPLRRTFPWRGTLVEMMRDAANWIVRFDPLMAAVYRRSAVTLCKTRETLERIPGRYHGKCLVQVEIGVDEPARPALCRRPAAQGQFRVLYAGRLVYWKGLHLGLMAFRRFRMSHPAATLTVIGSGPDEDWVRDLARRLGIECAVNWIPQIQQAAVMRMYPRHDVLLFPSLHDSSGNVVLEALSCSLPVICLDTGGPSVLVDSSCGFKVSPGERQQVVEDLARALAALADNPTLARAMEAAARHRAHEHFSWARQVSHMVQLYQSVRDGQRALDGHARLVRPGGVR